MARYESLLSRSAAPLRSDMDNNSMSREMNQQNLPPNLSTDPLDFFGAIRDLVEQSIPQQELKRYAPSQQKQQRKWKVEAPGAAAGSCSSGSGGESGLGGIVAQLEGENGTLRDRVSELERALRKAQGCPPKKVGVLVLMGAACLLVVLLLLLSLLMYGSRRTIGIRFLTSSLLLGLFLLHSSSAATFFLVCLVHIRIVTRSLVLYMVASVPLPLNFTKKRRGRWNLNAELMESISPAHLVYPWCVRVRSRSGKGQVSMQDDIIPPCVMYKYE